MMHAQTAPNVSDDVLLKMTLSMQVGPQTVLEVRSDGAVRFSKSVREPLLEVRVPEAELEALVFSKLPVEEFSRLKQQHEAIPSPVSCGMAANLYCKGSWYGVWNYGSGPISNRVAASMYEAVTALAKSFAERQDAHEVQQ